MRRLYSTFAGGWPGVGLILMRMVTGVAIAVPAGSHLLANTFNPTGIESVVLLGAGVLLALGLYTPIAGTLVTLIQIYGLFTLPANWLSNLLIATLAVALAMLGPGLWSVDARLFGWKRIEPQKRSPVHL